MNLNQTQRGMLNIRHFGPKKCFRAKPFITIKMLNIIINQRVKCFRAKLSTVQIHTFSNVSKRTATRDLTELVDKGILVIQGEGRGRVYQLKGP